MGRMVMVGGVATDYDAYLDSWYWREVKRAALYRAKGRCQVCNVSRLSAELNVHHRTYRRLGCERDEDLIVLCRDCHSLFHRFRRLS